MLEHAKQRTQQIIEAYELIKSSRQSVNCCAMQISLDRTVDSLRGLRADWAPRSVRC